MRGKYSYYFKLQRFYLKKSIMVIIGILCGLIVLLFLFKKRAFSQALATVIAWSDTLSMRWHLFIVGLLPVLLSICIFGTGIGIYLFTRYLYQRKRH